MRRLLGLLRDGDEELALAPQPSLARIDDLAASLTETGLPVEVRVEGTPVNLPPGIDVTAYRIVQEALTNTLKHAGPARAFVVVRYEPGVVELEVLDDGPGAAGGNGSGHGLAGIGERVAVYGGELASGRASRGRLCPSCAPAVRRARMIRVLLADDQSLVRAGFRMILKGEPDIEVVGEADDGNEAVRQAPSSARTSS